MANPIDPTPRCRAWDPKPFPGAGEDGPFSEATCGAAVSTYRAAGWIALVLLCATGCSDVVTPPDPEPSTHEAPAASEPWAQLRGIEAEFARIAEDVPGFGGYYYDEEDNLVGVMKDMAQVDAARLRLKPILEARRATGEIDLRTEAEVLFRQGEYDIFELAEIKERLLFRVFEIPDVVLAHIAEDQNRFAVGALPGSEAEVLRQLEALAREVGVPSEAIVVRAAGPIEPTHLRTRTRPLLGGLQVQYHNHVTESNPRCTMVPVHRFGERYAMTASHCTSVMGEVQPPSPFWQAWSWESEPFIGYEAVDPPYTVCSPYWPQVHCRNADVALVKLEESVSDSLGYIARTKFSNEFNWGVPGSLEIDPTNPTIRIVDESDGAVGWVIRKIGGTTGWTTGHITATGVNITFHRQGKFYSFGGSVEMTTYAELGDSGSPVFGNLNIHGHAHLSGVLFAANPDAKRTYFSPMSQVRADISGLVTHGDPPDPPPPPPLSVDIQGPTTVPPNETCTWWATGTGGEAPFNYQWSGVLSGTGSQIWGSLSSSGTLRVDISSSDSQEAWDELWVTVSPSAPSCGI